MMKPSMFALILAGLTFPSLAARAVELPDMKSGLWQTTIQHPSSKSPGARPMSASTCLNANVQAAARKSAADYVKKSCSKSETRRDGANWVTDMVCKLDKTTMTTHSVTSFNGDNAYHTEMTTTYEPPMAGMSHSGTTIDGKWLGACKGK